MYIVVLQKGHHAIKAVIKASSHPVAISKTDLKDRGRLGKLFSHLTPIFFNKLMMYAVVQQVCGVVSPDSVVLEPWRAHHDQEPSLEKSDTNIFSIATLVADLEFL